MGQAEGQVEHVFFFFGGFAKFIEPFRIDDNMAGRTGQRAFASAFKIDTVLVGDFQHRQAVGGIDFFCRSVGRDEDNFRRLVVLLKKRNNE